MRLLVVAESAHPAVLAGEERRLFDTLLEQAGGDPSGVGYLGVLPTTRIAEARSAYEPTARAIAEYAPDKVLALGATAATVVKRSKTKLAITKIRGMAEWLEYGERGGTGTYDDPYTDTTGRAMLVCTIQPIMALRKASEQSPVSPRDWFRDLGKDVYKWVQQDEPLPEPTVSLVPIDGGDPDADVEAIVCRDRDEVVAALDMLRGASAISVDLETEPGARSLARLRELAAQDPGGKAYAKLWKQEWPRSGVNPLDDRIMRLGIGARQADGRYLCVIIPGELAGPEVYDFLWYEERGRTIGHNFRFDLQFMATHFGHHAPNDAVIADTMLMNYLADERPVRSMFKAHGLKDISRYRYDIPDYHFEWPEFWSTPDEERDWDSHDRYLATDLSQTLRLFRDLSEHEFKEEPRLWVAHDLLMGPGSLAFAQAELGGAYVNREYLESYHRKLTRRMDRRLAALRSVTGNPDFNPGASDDVTELVFDEFGFTPLKTTAYKTASKRSSRKEQLEKLIETHGAANPREAKIMRAVMAWRRDQKARQTYAEGLLKASETDGMVHAQFNLGGTATGRLSSSDPNMQNIPKRGPEAKHIRKAFEAPPGWLLMECDYSQLELRVAALLSRDKRFAAVYKEGRDIHREVAAAMFRKPAEEIGYMERYLAKAVDFGALYGRSGMALAGGREMDYYEGKMGGTRWTEREAQAFIDRFIDGFPSLKEWLEMMGDAGIREQHIETLFGRRRRFPLIKREDVAGVRRQAFNSPIQSVASDLCLSAFCRLTFRLDPAEARTVLTVHDSILLEVREDAARDVARIVTEEMTQNIPGPVVRANEGMDIPFTIDIHVGRTWSDDDMKELEL